MSNQDLFTVDAIVESLIAKYELDTTAENYKNVYKQYVYRVMHAAKIWDKGIVKSSGKKTTRYFTAKQKQELEYLPKVYDYLRDNSTSAVLKNSKRYKDFQKEIDARRIEQISYLDERESNDDNAPVITTEHFNATKQAMMLEAIFNLFFTPFDDSLLESDMYRVHITADELCLTPEDIEAENRYSHPEGNYFRRRTD